MNVYWHPTSWLYGVQSGLFIKVGYCQNIKSRLQQFRLCNPHPCTLVARAMVDPTYARAAEKRCHQMLGKYAIGREWFMTSKEIVRVAMKAAVGEFRESALNQQMKEAATQQNRVRRVRKDDRGRYVFEDTGEFVK